MICGRGGVPFQHDKVVAFNVAQKPANKEPGCRDDIGVFETGGSPKIGHWMENTVIKCL